MKDSYISRNGLVVVAAWAVVAACMIGAWVTAFVHPNIWIVAAVLAASGCVATGVAVVAHMRLHTSQMCALIRVTSGIENAPDAEVRSIR